MPIRRTRTHPRSITAFLRYIDHCSYPPCRARTSLPVECRPKFISVAVLVARFWECSTPSNWFNLFGNCYNSRSPSARRHEAHTGFIAVLRYVDPCPGLPHRARRPLAATGAAPSKRSCECCAPALRAFALRVSRFDARGDAEHAERMLHEASAFAGVFNPVQQDQSL